MPKNKLIGDDNPALNQAMTTKLPTSLTNPSLQGGAGGLSRPAPSSTSGLFSKPEPKATGGGTAGGDKYMDSKGREWTKSASGGYVNAQGQKAGGISLATGTAGTRGYGSGGPAARDPLAGGGGGYKPAMISDSAGQRRNPGAPAFKPVTYQTKTSDLGGTEKTVTRMKNYDEQGRNQFGKVVNSAQAQRYAQGKV